MALNKRGQKAKHTVDRHLQAQRMAHYRRIVRTIPKGELLSLRQYLRHRAYAAMVCSILGERKLARVVWPWQARPVSPEADPTARVARGRSSNPTAL
jgi:hypothetical protein